MTLISNLELKEKFLEDLCETKPEMSLLDQVIERTMEGKPEVSIDLQLNLGTVERKTVKVEEYSFRPMGLYDRLEERAYFDNLSNRWVSRYQGEFMDISSQRESLTGRVDQDIPAVQRYQEVDEVPEDRGWICVCRRPRCAAGPFIKV